MVQNHSFISCLAAGQAAHHVALLSGPLSGDDNSQSTNNFLVSNTHHFTALDRPLEISNDIVFINCLLIDLLIDDWLIYRRLIALPYRESTRMRTRHPSPIDMLLHLSVTCISSSSISIACDKRLKFYSNFQTRSAYFCTLLSAVSIQTESALPV